MSSFGTHVFGSFQLNSQVPQRIMNNNQEDNNQGADDNNQDVSGNNQGADYNNQDDNRNNLDANGNNLDANENDQGADGNNQIDDNNQDADGNNQDADDNNQDANNNNQGADDNNQDPDGNYQGADGNNQDADDNHQDFNGNDQGTNSNNRGACGSSRFYSWIEYPSKGLLTYQERDYLQRLTLESPRFVWNEATVDSTSDIASERGGSSLRGYILDEMVRQNLKNAWIMQSAYQHQTDAMQLINSNMIKSLNNLVNLTDCVVDSVDICNRYFILEHTEGEEFSRVITKMKRLHKKWGELVKDLEANQPSMPNQNPPTSGDE